MVNNSLADAQAVWHALGAKQSGVRLVEILGTFAVRSAEGVVVFCKAFQDLHDRSGEGPRRVVVEGDLERAISEASGTLSGLDRDAVLWVLNELKRT